MAKFLKTASHWYREESGLRPSSAQLMRVASFLTAGQEGARLSRLYARLKGAPAPPNFESVADLCAALQPAKAGDHPLLGTIIETRAHQNCILVLERFIAATGMHVQFFHGTDNARFLRDHIPASLQEQVTLVELPVSQLDAGAYNALVLSEAFWLALAGRQKILMFQTDALTCAETGYTIEDFLDFDYIGSRWRRRRPLGLVCDGGNGGLSLRDWQRSVECLKRFPPEAWPGGEDGYFAFHMDLMGARVGRRRDCAKFSTQYSFEERSWGVHKPGSLPPEDLKALLEYEPEARHLL